MGEEENLFMARNLTMKTSKLSIQNQGCFQWQILEKTLMEVNSF